MKVQFSVNDAILAASILIIFYVILQFSIPRVTFDETKYLRLLSYDILFAIDKLYNINGTYERLKNVLTTTLLNLNITPIFLISDYGLLRSDINILCICENQTFLNLINNKFRNININGRKINITFIPATFSSIKTEFENHGLLIFGCNETLRDHYAELTLYLNFNGILFMCDINQSYYNDHSLVLSKIFNLNTSINNGNLLATLVKPRYGYIAPYKPFKILKYQFEISENTNFNLLTTEIIVKPNNSDMYLFRQIDSEIAAATLTYYGRNIVGWSVNFYRDGNLDDNEARIFLSLILSVVSYKDPTIDERFRKNLIPYVSFHYHNFTEPFILYFSLLT